MNQRPVWTPAPQMPSCSFCIDSRVTVERSSFPSINRVSASTVCLTASLFCHSGEQCTTDPRGKDWISLVLSVRNQCPCFFFVELEFIFLFQGIRVKRIIIRLISSSMSSTETQLRFSRLKESWPTEVSHHVHLCCIRVHRKELMYTYI